MPRVSAAAALHSGISSVSQAKSLLKFDSISAVLLFFPLLVSVFPNALMAATRAFISSCESAFLPAPVDSSFFSPKARAITAKASIAILRISCRIHVEPSLNTVFNISVLYGQIPGCVKFFDTSGNLSIHLQKTDSGNAMPVSVITKSAFTKSILSKRRDTT